MLLRYLAVCAAAMVTGCATVTPPPTQVEAPVTKDQQIIAQKLVPPTEKNGLKRKVAIGRFSNETRYGRTFQTDANLDPLGKQASDILMSRLVATQSFIVLERSDLSKVNDEQKLTKVGSVGGLIGADTLIIGSVTEFGRSTTGTSGFLSGTKIQTATAKVEVRLVDVATGLAFFSTSGSGLANTESGSIAGFGSRADYDGSLNDKAISAAISDMLGRLVTKLEDRPWHTDILKVSGKQVIIAAGTRQGLKVGAQLQVFKAGEKVKNPQTGFTIDLPAQPIGVLQVASLFGDSETNEGAICELISGSATTTPAADVFVRQVQK